MKIPLKQFTKGRFSSRNLVELSESELDENRRKTVLSNGDNTASQSIFLFWHSTGGNALNSQVPEVARNSPFYRPQGNTKFLAQ